MPKQVYVYPANINDADTIEGLRNVLEPAVDTTYTFDSSAGAYVDVNNNSNHLPDSVYLQRGNILGNAARLHKHHYTGQITDSNGNEIMLAVVSSNYNRHYVLLKEDLSQTSGYSTLTTGNVSSYTLRYYQDVHIKPLWDDTAQTIFIAIFDAVFWTTSSASDRNSSTYRAVALVKYDKSADSLSVIQEITDSSILRSYPLSEIMFYYDSTNDAWTFYQPRLGYNGDLKMRKITATQTGVSTTAETLSLSGASFTPKFPDGLSDPMYYYTRSGLSLQRGWVELSAILDANSDSFTIVIPDSPNIDTSTSISDLIAEEQLKFLRGTWSYNSGSWTFTVSSELIVDAPGKQILGQTASFSNNKKAVPIFVYVEPPGGYDYTFFEFAQLEKVSDVTAMSDISVTLYTKKRTKNNIYFNNKVYGAYNSSGDFIISDTMPETYSYGQLNMLSPIQIDSTDDPAFLLQFKGSNGAVLLKVDSTQKINLAPQALKYVYDVSSLSSAGHKYYIINRIQNHRLASYIYRAHALLGSSKKAIVVHDVDNGSADFSSLGLMSPTYNYTVGGSALNYSSGGTITSVYNRSGSSLKNLTFWIRSGSTMYAPFLVFSAQLDDDSLLKYIADNTNVDTIFVTRVALQSSVSTLYLASPFSTFYDKGSWSTNPNDNVPNPSAGVIYLRNAGNIIGDYSSHGYSMYYNPTTQELIVDNDETADSLVLSSMALHITRNSPSSGNSDRHTRYLASADGIGTILFTDYFLQAFRNYWTADYEDTLEISVGSSTYKYVIIGKYSLDGVSRVVAVLEDVV